MKLFGFCFLISSYSYAHKERNKREEKNEMITIVPRLCDAEAKFNWLLYVI